MSFRLTSPKPEHSEQDVIKACIQVLGQRGYWCKRNPVGKYKEIHTGNFIEMGPPGIPDYTAMHPTYPAFLLEFKRPGKLLRPEQVTQFHKIQFGFRLAAVMVDSTEELLLWLDGHEKRAREIWNQNECTNR